MPIEDASLWRPEIMRVHKKITGSESLVDLCLKNGFRCTSVSSTADLYFSKRFVWQKIVKIYILKLLIQHNMVIFE